MPNLPRRRRTSQPPLTGSVLPTPGAHCHVLIILLQTDPLFRSGDLCRHEKQRIVGNGVAIFHAEGALGLIEIETASKTS
jgi:hypothetical protein